jgi:hypothetical protein
MGELEQAKKGEEHKDRELTPKVAKLNFFTFLLAKVEK